ERGQEGGPRGSAGVGAGEGACCVEVTGLSRFGFRGALLKHSRVLGGGAAAVPRRFADAIQTVPRPVPRRDRGVGGRPAEGTAGDRQAGYVQTAEPPRPLPLQGRPRPPEARTPRRRP